LAWALLFLGAAMRAASTTSTYGGCIAAALLGLLSVIATSMFF
jgi:hypothetical protein